MKGREHQMHKSCLISVSADTACYRHIRISVDSTLFDLHAAILEAFEFEDDHAHAFFMNNRAWSDEDEYLSEDIDDASRHTNATKLCELAMDVGKQFKYVFDFGDNWQFQCKVLRILDEETAEPVVVRSVGDAPMQYEDDGPYFPEEYDEATLKRMYADLALPNETIELLREYFDAFANLYNIIPLRKALEIYNRQNPPISEPDFAAFVEVARHERLIYSILGEDELYWDGEAPKDALDRELIEDSLLYDIEDYEELKAAQADKPYYIPNRGALLEYADEFYFERTPEFYELQKYIHSRMRVDKDRAEELAEELQMHASFGEQDMQHILSDMGRMGVRFKDLEQTKDFISRYYALGNNTRTAFNRGHTPLETQAMSGPPKAVKFGPGLKGGPGRGELDIEEMRRSVMNMAFPNAEMKASYMDGLDRIQPKAKVGRNDPCPCGSGKKYKHCCGKNV